MKNKIDMANQRLVNIILADDFLETKDMTAEEIINSKSAEIEAFVLAGGKNEINR